MVMPMSVQLINLMAALMLLIAFPQISLWLPSLMG